MQKPVKTTWWRAASLLITTIIAAALFIGVGVAMVHANPPAKETRVLGFTEAMPPLYSLPRTYTKEARAEKLKSLIASVDALILNELRNKTSFKRRIAEAALHAEETVGVDAVFMVALARQESDFRNLILINTACTLGRSQRGCYADCGMTQHHVRGSRAYVHRECKKLKLDMKYAFKKSAEEIALHIRWCEKMRSRTWVRPLRRCVLNRYNQGPSYRTAYRCKRRWPCESTRREDAYFRTPHCIKSRKKCMSRAAYWKNLTCFEYGARHHVREKRSCRFCYRLNKIATRFYPPLPSARTATPQTAADSTKSLATK